MAQEFWKNDAVVAPQAMPAPVAGAIRPIIAVPERQPPPQTPDQVRKDALEVAKTTRDLATPEPVQGAPGYFWGPDGRPFKPEGLPAGIGGDPKLQEAERTAAFLATRLAGGIKDLGVALQGDPGAAKPGVTGSILGSIFGDGARNFVNSPARRQVEAAQMEVLDSALTLGTGAAYTQEQLESYRQAYFPALSDDADTIKAKQQRLLRLLEAARLKSGSAAPQIDAIIGEIGGTSPVLEGGPGGAVPSGGTFYQLSDLPAPPAPLSPDFVESEALAVPEGEVFREWGVRDGQAYPVFGPPTQRVDNNGLVQGADAIVRGAVNVATLGFDQEIAALVDTVFKGGTYNRNLIEQNAVDSFDEQNNAGARLTGQLAGGFLLPTGLRGVVEKRAAEVLARGGSQAEAIAAARSAVIPQLTKEGAGYGAAYGAGEADPGLTSRAGGAAVGAAVGAGAGAAVAKLGGRLLVPGGAGKAPANVASDQIEAARAATELGIDLPRFVAGEPGAQNMGASLGRSMGGAKPISEATVKMLDQAKAASDDVAASLGTAVEPEAMGTVAVTAGKRSIKAERARVGNIYKQAENAAQNVRIEATDTGAILNQLASNEEQTLGNTGAGKIFRELLTSLRERGGMLSINGARSTRSELRKRLAKEAELSPDNADRLTDMVMKAVGSDIDRGLIAAGKDKAVPLYRQADREWRAALAREEDIIKPFIGKQGDNWGDDAARNIMRDVKANGPRIAQFLDSIDPAEANDIRATVVANLGRSKDGAQNAAGDAFSLDTFLTNWNGIKGARNLIFPKETVQALDKLAVVAERVKTTGRNRPPSGGAIWGAAMASPTAIGGGVSLTTGDPTAFTYGAMASALLAGGQRGAGKWLSSPKLAQRLAATPMAPKAALNYWSRPWVANMAKAEPAIATDLLGFQRSIVEALSGKVERSAAATDSEKKAGEKR